MENRVLIGRPAYKWDTSALDFLLPWRRFGALGVTHQRLRFMWQSYIYGMHWEHDGRMYYDEIPAESKEDAAEFFIDHKRDDVVLIRTEFVGPNEGGVREPVHSPYSPFSPLMARRKLDEEEDVR